MYIKNMFRYPKANYKFLAWDQFVGKFGSQSIEAHIAFSMTASCSRNIASNANLPKNARQADHKRRKIDYEM